MKCPFCGYEISSMLPEDLPEENLRFCPQCGSNYRYNCPICNKTMISIIGIGPKNEIRCSECESLFYVCEKCGRLSEPYLKYCPDEECGGMLLSPRLSSNIYNGTGFCDNFEIKLSLNQEKFKSKSKELYENETVDVYSAKIIGGYLFVWHDSLVDVFNIDLNFKKITSIPTLGAEKSSISPCMALLGDNVILASKEKFLWFNLNGIMELGEVKGTPIALISGHCGVAMWTKYRDSYCLYTALCPKINTAPNIKKIEFSSDNYELLEKSNCLAMDKKAVYWQGKSKNIYKYDFFNDSLKEIPFENGKIDYIWTDSSNKVSVALSDSAKLCICNDLENNKDETFNTFDGFVNNIYVYKDKYSSTEYAYILDNKIMKNGDAKYSAPNGEHVNSILCKEDNGTPVLISMFKNIQYGNLFVNIYAQRKDSGSPDSIWDAGNMEPIEMLCFENKIFVIHKRGIVIIERIKDESNNDSKDNLNDDFIKCPNCGAKQPKDDTNFCSECGNPIEISKTNIILKIEDLENNELPKDEKAKIQELLAKLNTKK